MLLDLRDRPGHKGFKASLDPLGLRARRAFRALPDLPDPLGHRGFKALRDPLGRPELRAFRASLDLRDPPELLVQLASLDQRVRRVRPALRVFKASRDRPAPLEPPE